MINQPKVKLAVIGVSRDCFPATLTKKRVAAVMAEAKKAKLAVVDCPVTIENEIDAMKALEWARKEGVNACCMISKAELERGIRATEAQLSEAMTDPEFRRECAEMDARYAAMELVESLLRSKSGIRKMNAYHDNYHRDFDIMVSLGENDEDSISRSSRDLVFA